MVFMEKCLLWLKLEKSILPKQEMPESEMLEYTKAVLESENRFEREESRFQELGSMVNSPSRIPPEQQYKNNFQSHNHQIRKSKRLWEQSQTEDHFHDYALSLVKKCLWLVDLGKPIKGLHDLPTPDMIQHVKDWMHQQGEFTEETQTKFSQIDSDISEMKCRKAKKLQYYGNKGD